MRMLARLVLSALPFCASLPPPLPPSHPPPQASPPPEFPFNSYSGYSYGSYSYGYSYSYSYAGDSVAPPLHPLPESPPPCTPPCSPPTRPLPPPPQSPPRPPSPPSSHPFPPAPPPLAPLFTSRLVATLRPPAPLTGDGESSSSTPSRFGGNYQGAVSATDYLVAVGAYFHDQREPAPIPNLGCRSARWIDCTLDRLRSILTHYNVFNLLHIFHTHDVCLERYLPAPPLLTP